MALSTKDLQRYQEVISTTGAQRESMAAVRSVPAEYAAQVHRVVRTTETIAVPAVQLPVKVHVAVAKERRKNCPVHINLHGGGFYFGHSDDDDLYCARLAAELQGIVLDVDYALSPEHPFPAAFEQSYETARWAFRRCAEWDADPERVSIGGQSAGGNLAAAVALRAAKTGDFRLCLQVLDYAALDLLVDVAGDPESQASGNPMKKRGAAFSMLYCDGDPDLLGSPYVSPALAPEAMLVGLAPMCIVSAGLCPFRDIDEGYGLRAAAQGVEVTLRRFVDSRHSFTVRMLDEWQQSQEFITRAIKRVNI